LIFVKTFVIFIIIGLVNHKNGSQLGEKEGEKDSRGSSTMLVHCSVLAGPSFGEENPSLFAGQQLQQPGQQLENGPPLSEDLSLMFGQHGWSPGDTRGLLQCVSSVPPSMLPLSMATGPLNGHQAGSLGLQAAPPSTPPPPARVPMSVPSTNSSHMHHQTHQAPHVLILPPIESGAEEDPLGEPAPLPAPVPAPDYEGDEPMEEGAPEEEEEELGPEENVAESSADFERTRPGHHSGRNASTTRHFNRPAETRGPRFNLWPTAHTNFTETNSSSLWDRLRPKSPSGNLFRPFGRHQEPGLGKPKRRTKRQTSALVSNALATNTAIDNQRQLFTDSLAQLITRALTQANNRRPETILLRQLAANQESGSSAEQVTSVVGSLLPIGQQLVGSILRQRIEDFPIIMANLGQLLANMISTLTVNNPMLTNSPTLQRTRDILSLSASPNSANGSTNKSSSGPGEQASAGGSTASTLLMELLTNIVRMLARQRPKARPEVPAERDNELDEGPLSSSLSLVGERGQFAGGNSTDKAALLNETWSEASGRLDSKRGKKRRRADGRKSIRNFADPTDLAARQTIALTLGQVARSSNGSVHLVGDARAKRSHRKRGTGRQAKERRPRRQRRTKRSLGAMLMMGPFSKLYVAMMLHKMVKHQSGMLSQAILGELVRRYLIPGFTSALGSGSALARGPLVSQAKQALSKAALFEAPARSSPSGVEAQLAAIGQPPHLHPAGLALNSSSSQLALVRTLLHNAALSASQRPASSGSGQAGTECQFMQQLPNGQLVPRGEPIRLSLAHFDPQLLMQTISPLANNLFNAALSEPPIRVDREAGTISFNLPLSQASLSIPTQPISLLTQAAAGRLASGGQDALGRLIALHLSRLDRVPATFSTSAAGPASTLRTFGLPGHTGRIPSLQVRRPPAYQPHSARLHPRLRHPVGPRGWPAGYPRTHVGAHDHFRQHWRNESSFVEQPPEEIGPASIDQLLAQASPAELVELLNKVGVKLEGGASGANLSKSSLQAGNAWPSELPEGAVQLAGLLNLRNSSQEEDERRVVSAREKEHTSWLASQLLRLADEKQASAKARLSSSGSSSKEESKSGDALTAEELADRLLNRTLSSWLESLANSEGNGAKSGGGSNKLVEETSNSLANSLGHLLKTVPVASPPAEKQVEENGIPKENNKLQTTTSTRRPAVQTQLKTMNEKRKETTSKPAGKATGSGGLEQVASKKSGATEQPAAGALPKSPQPAKHAAVSSDKTVPQTRNSSGVSPAVAPPEPQAAVDEEPAPVSIQATAKPVASNDGLSQAGGNQQQPLNNLAMALNVMNLVLLNQKLANSTKSNAPTEPDKENALVVSNQLRKAQSLRGPEGAGRVRMKSISTNGKQKTVTSKRPSLAQDLTSKSGSSEKNEGNNHRTSSNSIASQPNLFRASDTNRNSPEMNLNYRYQPLKTANNLHDGSLDPMKQSIDGQVDEHKDDTISEKDHAARWNDVLQHLSLSSS